MEGSMTPRQRAAAAGETFYFTGVPCIHGHLSPRRVKDKRCRECDREKSRHRYHNDPVANAKAREVSKQKAAARKALNAERRSSPEYAAQVAAAREATKLRLKIKIQNDLKKQARMYATDEVYRELVKARNRESYRRNVAATTARTSARRLGKRNRTPSWLSADQRAQMVELYRESRRVSKETGVPHDVDHIVPLHGRKVSGLHVPWNLRVITRRANRQKQNQFLV